MQTRPSSSRASQAVAVDLAQRQQGQVDDVRRVARAPAARAVDELLVQRRCIHRAGGPGRGARRRAAVVRSGLMHGLRHGTDLQRVGTTAPWRRCSTRHRPANTDSWACTPRPSASGRTCAATSPSPSTWLSSARSASDSGARSMAAHSPPCTRQCRASSARCSRPGARRRARPGSRARAAPASGRSPCRVASPSPAVPRPRAGIRDPGRRRRGWGTGFGFMADPLKAGSS
jgi:hypothetical protein